MKLLILLLLCFFVSLNLAQSDEQIDSEWWKHTIIYEILPFSFKDSNRDGIGDIKGIISKLDYFKELGIETLHTTPMHKTGMKDMGYDIYNYYSIDPRFGTMADFEELIREMKKRNMKLILDLVINHSSDKHKWFRKSIQRIYPYTDFYIWKDPKGYDSNGNPIPPNKWVSVFGGQPSSAWTWNSKRKQYYFHQFLKEQVDFDLRNPRVIRELKKIIKFWLNKGVSGFRLDAALFYIEDEEFRDDDHQIRQYNQNENYEFIHELREFLDQYNKKHGGPERIFIAEAHSDPHIVRQFYDRPCYNITHFPYTFGLRYINSEISSDELNNIIEPWLQQLPSNAVSAWMTQDHDGNRVGSRIRPEYMDILTTISMMLPGNVGVYYGQEIGMMDGPIEPHQIRDYSGGGTRDPARLPMQWDDSINGGFSSNRTTFLPPNPDYQYINVKSQESQPTSHLQLFKDLSDLRLSEVFKHGDFQSYTPHKDVYVFTRSYNGTMIIVLSNLNYLKFSINIRIIINNLPNKISVAAASTNSEYQSGANVGCYTSQNFISAPYSSVVLEAYYDKKYPNCYFDKTNNLWDSEETSSSSEYNDDDY